MTSSPSRSGSRSPNPMRGLPQLATVGSVNNGEEFGDLRSKLEKELGEFFFASPPALRLWCQPHHPICSTVSHCGPID